MCINITDLKKKIIYRSSYRGTKEMDSMLSTFTKKYINLLNDEDLFSLSKLLDIDDENLFKFIKGQKTTVKIEDNNVSKLLRKFNNK